MKGKRKFRNKIMKYLGQIMRFKYLCYICTVLPAKSWSDVMFVYKVIRDLESIDYLFINPISISIHSD